MCRHLGTSVWDAPHVILPTPVADPLLGIPGSGTLLFHLTLVFCWSFNQVSVYRSSLLWALSMDPPTPLRILSSVTLACSRICLFSSHSFLPHTAEWPDKREFILIIGTEMFALGGSEDVMCLPTLVSSSSWAYPPLWLGELWNVFWSVGCWGKAWLLKSIAPLSHAFSFPPQWARHKEAPEDCEAVMWNKPGALNYFVEEARPPTHTQGPAPLQTSIVLWSEWDRNLFVLEHWDLGFICYIS